MHEWYRLPLGDWVDTLVDAILEHFRTLFRGISGWVGEYVGWIESALNALPFWLIILIAIWVTYRLVGKGVALFALLGLLLVSSLGLWDRAMATLALVITATLVSMLIGIPLGILAARSRTLDTVLRPFLDLMQTMPSFVYLIPALMFFGMGEVPGVIATVIFAMPPVIRLTNLGIRQVATDLTDAARAFGATQAQTLFGVQLPLALPTIMAGINQTIMLSLSMVVIAAMIGAGGLGAIVLEAIQRVQIGSGFEGGIAIVVFAILLDRTTQALAKRRPRSKAGVWGWAPPVLLAGVASFFLVTQLWGAEAPDERTIRIAMPPWTTSPPPTYVAKALLEELGYRVIIQEGDVGIAFQGVAAGDIDLLLDAWLPNLHANYFETYGDRIETLGEPLYSGTEMGWGVPSYVPIDSVTQLNQYVNEFGGRVVGIEPGAGMMEVSRQVIEAYQLDYQLIEGSEFGMLATLNDAVRAGDWIVFIAWRPHFKFIQHDLKILDEPLGLWTDDYVVKAARPGFSESFPDAAHLLGEWTMPLDDVDWLMHEIEVKERPPDAVAQEWVERNRERIDAWLDGLPSPEDGEQAAE